MNKAIQTQLQEKVQIKFQSTECFYFESQNPVFLFTKTSRISFFNHSKTSLREPESLPA